MFEATVFNHKIDETDLNQKIKNDRYATEAITETRFRLTGAD